MPYQVMSSLCVYIKGETGGNKIKGANRIGKGEINSLNITNTEPSNSS